MLTRIIAGLALIPLSMFIIVGGLPLYILESILLFIAIREFYDAFKEKNINAIHIVAYIFIFYIFLKNQFNLGMEYTYMIIFSLFIYSITYLLRVKNNILDIAITFFGILYIVTSIDFIVLTLNSFELGKIYVWTIFIISFCTDTFAYFTGYLFGKHKLIPKVSPKKTIEGSIGGILGSGCSILGAFTVSLDIANGSSNPKLSAVELTSAMGLCAGVDTVGCGAGISSFGSLSFLFFLFCFFSLFSWIKSVFSAR